MDTTKLLKAIQILVEAEVMKQLPLIKEQVRKELTESKIPAKKPMLSMTKAILDDEPVPVTKTRRYSSNPMINEILNATDGGILMRESQNGVLHNNSAGMEDYPTMTFNSGDMGKLVGGAINVVTTNPEGKPLDLSRPEVAPVVNAMNRDYSALMTAIAQKKK